MLSVTASPLYEIKSDVKTIKSSWNKPHKDQILHYYDRLYTTG